MRFLALAAAAVMMALSPAASSSDSVGGMTGLATNLGAPPPGMKVLRVGNIPQGGAVDFDQWSAVFFQGSWVDGDAAPLNLMIGRLPNGQVRAAFGGLTSFIWQGTLSSSEQCAPSPTYPTFCMRLSGGNLIVRTNSVTSAAYMVFG